MIIGPMPTSEKAKLIKNYLAEHKGIVRVVVIGDKIPEIMPDELLATRKNTFHQDAKHNEIIRTEYFNCNEIIYCTPRAVTYYIVMYDLIALLAKGTLFVLNNIIKPQNIPTLVNNSTLTYGTILKLVRAKSPK